MIVVATGTVTAVVTGVVSVSNIATGTVSISGTVPVTGTIQNIASISTLLGTAVVSVVPGLSVSAVVSGTVSLVTVSTVGTVVTLLGTVLVSISGITPTSTMSGFTSTLAVPVLVMGGTTTQASGVTGQLNWLAASQTLVSVGTVGTVSTIVTVLTVVTILGTQIVTLVPLTSVALSGTQWTETSQSGLTTGVGVWLAPTQTMAIISTVATVVTVLSTVVVTNPIESQVLSSMSAMLSGLSAIFSQVTFTTLSNLNTSGFSTLQTGMFVFATGIVNVVSKHVTPVLLVAFSSSGSSNSGRLAFNVYVSGFLSVFQTTAFVPGESAWFRLRHAYIGGAVCSTPGQGGVAIVASGTTGSPTITSAVSILQGAGVAVYFPFNGVTTAWSASFQNLDWDIAASVGGAPSTIQMIINTIGAGATWAVASLIVYGYYF
jgi:hypothetical protein